MNEMTQREKDIFACTEILAKTILDREFKMIGSSTATVTINIQTSDGLTIDISLTMKGV